MCAHINDLQRWPLEELLAVTTEQLTAVMALSHSRFRYLQENEQFYHCTKKGQHFDILKSFLVRHSSENENVG